MFKRLNAVAAGLGLLVLSAAPALSQGTLRIGMTAADIPQTTGQPDQGFEGYRFAGYTIYDGLVNWDLSKADALADIKPGLATEWSAVEGDGKRWIFKLRQGVKFHDGTDFDAAAAKWNLDYRMDAEVKSPSRQLLVEAIESVDVIEILVQPGDEVSLETPLITLESDKATMDIPSSHAGVVREVRVREGDRLAEGRIIAVIEASDASLAAAAPEALGWKPLVIPNALVVIGPWGDEFRWREPLHAQGIGYDDAYRAHNVYHRPFVQMHRMPASAVE